jgi:hypothetical protein
MSNAIISAIINSNTANNVVASDKAASAAAPTASAVSSVLISNLIATRKEWEVGVHRTSNLQLYSILTSCLQFHNDLSVQHHKSADRAQFEEFCTANGIKFKSDTKLVLKVVKCVFYDEAADRNAQRDRRRISAYATVLRRAISDNIAPADLSAWIETNGGVEQVRLAKGKVISPSFKAAQAREAVEATDRFIAVVQNDTLNGRFDTDDYDRPCVVLVVPRKDGTLEIRAVVKSAGAVNATLAAHYKEAVVVSGSQAAPVQAKELAAA